MEIMPYTPCVAVYHFESGRLVITIQGDPNKAIEVMAEALIQDGYPHSRQIAHSQDFRDPRRRSDHEL